MQSEKLALNVTEAAELMNVSRPTMYNIIHREDFDAAFKVGTRTLVSRPRLERWIDRQCGGNDAGK